MKISHLVSLAALCIVLLATHSEWSAAQEPRTDDVRLKVSVKVDMRPDVGQNFGTLFEIIDDSGEAVAGAGFLGNYNTEARSDRRKLHFYSKAPEGVRDFKLDPVPRISDDAGFYLHEFDGRLFAHSRAGGRDAKLRAWDDAARRWRIDESTPIFSVHVADGVLVAMPSHIAYNNRRVVELGPTAGRIAEWYYANGNLIFKRSNAQASPAENELIAVPWTPGDAVAADPAQGTVLRLRTAGEFVYALGQLNDRAFAATNIGGIYAFDGRRWKVWREPDGVSFQIYSMVNYDNRLLMGQYPTGNLFEFDGTRFGPLPNQPPAMPGVSPNAREAQTLTIYGGELYAGVWPWGEVWRLDRASSEWTFMGRVFTHPQPTSETTHPYEKETTALDPVLNRWGQRVASMVPHGESLWISTSAKSSLPFESKFKFLGDNKWQEYGAVYRYRQPGQLSVQTNWNDAPTRFEFVFTDDRVTITQDGQQLGSAALDASAASRIVAAAKFQFGRGVYGPFRGPMLESTSDIRPR